MSLCDPIEIYVDPPVSLDFQSVRWYLIYIVTPRIDWDPSLVPLPSRPPGTQLLHQKEKDTAMTLRPPDSGAKNKHR